MYVGYMRSQSRAVFPKTSSRSWRCRVSSTVHAIRPRSTDTDTLCGEASPHSNVRFLVVLLYLYAAMTNRVNRGY